MEKLDFLEVDNASQQIEIQLCTIYKLLKDQFRFSVPHYQRAYKWKPEEVSRLLADVQNSRENNESYYLIGPVVLIQPNASSDRYDIVDGQQRLTTITFTLKIIQRRISEIVEAGLSQFGISAVSEEGKKLVDLSSFLNACLKSSPTSEPLIRYQRASHDESFEHYFDDSFAKKPEVSSMNSAVTAIKEFIDSELTDASRLLNFVEHLLGNVCVALISVDRMDAAYSLFESLNHKGEKLRPIDLVRNSIFMYMDDDNISLCSEKWNSLELIIQSIHGSRAVDSHIRDLFLTYFECKIGKPLEEKDIFPEVKKEFQSNSVVENLATFSEIVSSGSDSFFSFYNMSVSSSSPRWHSVFSDSPKHMLDQITKRKVFRSAITACLSGHNSGYVTTEEVTLFLNDLYSLVARTQVLGNIPVTRYGQIFAHFAHIVFGGLKGTSFSEVAIEAITEACKVRPVVPDQEFIRALTANRNLAKDKAKWLLRDIEISQNTNNTSARFSDAYAGHIFPEDSGDNWPEFDRGAESLYLNSLGNFALLEGLEINADTGRSFLEKKDEYRASEFRHTKSLSRKESWTEHEIEKRSKSLAKKSTTVWPIYYLAT